MAVFISRPQKPRIVHAVQWDGASETIGEVKALTGKIVVRSGANLTVVDHRFHELEVEPGGYVVLEGNAVVAYNEVAFLARYAPYEEPPAVFVVEEVPADPIVVEPEPEPEPEVTPEPAVFIAAPVDATPPRPMRKGRA
jgi:hypothetical protein